MRLACPLESDHAFFCALAQAFRFLAPFSSMKQAMILDFTEIEPQKNGTYVQGSILYTWQGKKQCKVKYYTRWQLDAEKLRQLEVVNNRIQE